MPCTTRRLLPAAARVTRVVRVAFAAATFGATSAPLAAQHDAAAGGALVKVAARRLPRGTVLREHDITVVRATPREGARDTESPVTAGWVTRRLVRPGEPLRPPAVAPAPLVAAGSAVRVVVQGAAFQLSVDGVAAVSASLGDTIPVRLGARRRVRGVVTGPAEVVAVDPPRNP